MSSEVFWMSRDRKDDGVSEGQIKPNENDFPLPSPHIQGSGDGEVDPPSYTFNISAFLRQTLRICSTDNYNDWEIKSTRSVLRVRY